MKNWSMKYFIRPRTIVLTDAADNLAWMEGVPAEFVPFSVVENSGKIHDIAELPEAGKEQLRLLRDVGENDERENLRVYSIDDKVIAGYAGNPNFFVCMSWETYLYLSDQDVDAWEKLWGNTYENPIQAAFIPHVALTNHEGVYYNAPGDEWEE